MSVDYLEQLVILSVLGVAVLLAGTAAGVLVSRRRTTPPPLVVPEDIEIVRELGIHQQEGAELGKLGRDVCSEPRLRRLGAAILEEELERVGRMRGWMEIWQAHQLAGPDEVEWDFSDPWSGDLAQLRRTPQGRFDMAFVQAMRRHWEDGAAFAESIPATCSPVVAELVRSVVEMGHRRLAETNNTSTGRANAFGNAGRRRNER